MKKISLVVALFVAIGAFAQKQHPQKETFTAEQKTQLMVKKMSLELDLSKKQISKITPIVAEKVNKMEAKIAEFKVKREAKTKRKALTSDEKYNMAIAQLDEKIALQNQMKSILNKEQYATWKQMHKKHEQRGKMMAHHKTKERFKKDIKKRHHKDGRKQKFDKATPEA
ncbi:hypothetical protein [Wenyingzhuangia marina]|uniref:LTXXQ motif family protein n=1 Tax=Wenyingzhuangia marina TaxID=1195760 RepID=A0A1M5SF72_9FLAO|nr:hypothetical protein [Wenyingzhuangia marina]GGF61993.1 hypothetical protein GCM10011397_01360 [Wenyingzhuangia marina]SHH37095.1 hypothetical protein SAMN05444281_0275 [Wenyingzhuangia marina]